MAKHKEKFVREKPHCNIGTIGHVDHGKTTLTAAITKVLAANNNMTKFMKYSDIDKHLEEQRRGITISAAHVEYYSKCRHYTHIDCPGHQNYIKNMITGATQMEGAILVVALTEGPQEQTREHVILAKEVGIPYLIVYGNKLDMLLEDDLKEFVEMEVRELVSTYSYPEDLPFICGSARKALEEEEASEIGTKSVMKLIDIVDEYVKQPERPENEPFLMSIEEVYSISGRGTVVTGKIEKGKLSIGEEVEIVGSKLFKTVCTGLEMYNKFLDVAIAGENVGALVRGLNKKDLKRGFVMCKPGTIKAYNAFTARAYFLTSKEGGRKKPFFSKYMPQFFFRTANLTGSVLLSDDNSIVMPGDTVTFEVVLLEKAAINEGLRFAMREGAVTLGAGIILKVFEK
ncbi:elongation factor Tu-like [Schistocerca gregaria]|uniref:elongation factor Tu-like n=1 Tax=Schistocerca gregaria TaxID=7010 RepID=UPI00211EB86E|nr:elongation factor Tu-like [Schistocerca gregaria]XP_049850327.1 elongation factor Tu-like [Schistocerca gregaria]XP_049852756.1 elongation factor Tu-like [Schistocerca gregaria]